MSLFTLSQSCEAFWEFLCRSKGKLGRTSSLVIFVHTRSININLRAIFHPMWSHKQYYIHVLYIWKIPSPFSNTDICTSWNRNWKAERSALGCINISLIQIRWFALLDWFELMKGDSYIMVLTYEKGYMRKKNIKMNAFEEVERVTQWLREHYLSHSFCVNHKWS